MDFAAANEVHRLGRDENTFAMWTVYDHPADWPDHFVARLWVLPPNVRETVPTDSWIMADTLDDLREMMQGLTCMPRSPNDPPHIVETWL